MRKFIYDILNKFLSNPKDKNFRVLAYHTVPDEIAFEKQLLFLKNNYNLVSIIELRDALESDNELPETSGLITFDDGDISVYEKGFPILKKLAIPSAMFVITGLIDSKKTFWCRWVEKFYQSQGKTYSEARTQVNRLKNIPEEDRRKYLANIPEIESEQLNSLQLQELNESGMFIGNHTHTHPMINNCNENQIREEMYAAKAKFKDLGLQENFPVFAYPNGNWEPDSEKVLMKEGIKMAFLFDHKLNGDISSINPMRISRIRVNSDDDLSEFKVKVSGLHSRILNLRQNIGI